MQIPAGFFLPLVAAPDDLPLFWLAAPVTGLLVQPIIGYLSDNTWHPFWGRTKTILFCRGYPGHYRPVPDAQFNRFMDGSSRSLVDGCFDQYFYGALQSVCRG